MIRKIKNMNKTKLYAILLIILILVVAFFSVLLEICSRNTEREILESETKQEEQTDATEEMDTVKEDFKEASMQEEDEKVQSETFEKESEQEESIKEQRQEYDKKLADYEEKFSPDIVGEEEDVRYFLDTEIKKKLFLKTIADFAYSIWGEIDVERIKIGTLVTENEEELCYQIQIATELETMPCEVRYDKKQQIFGLY